MRSQSAFWILLGLGHVTRSVQSQQLQNCPSASTTQTVSTGPTTFSGDGTYHAYTATTTDGATFTKCARGAMLEGGGEIYDGIVDVGPIRGNGVNTPVVAVNVHSTAIIPTFVYGSLFILPGATATISSMGLSRVVPRATVYASASLMASFVQNGWISLQPSATVDITAVVDLTFTLQALPSAVITYSGRNTPIPDLRPDFSRTNYIQTLNIGPATLTGQGNRILASVYGGKATLSPCTHCILSFYGGTGSISGSDFTVVADTVGNPPPYGIITGAGQGTMTLAYRGLTGTAQGPGVSATVGANAEAHIEQGATATVGAGATATITSGVATLQSGAIAVRAQAGATVTFNVGARATVDPNASTTGAARTGATPSAFVVSVGTLDNSIIYEGRAITSNGVVLGRRAAAQADAYARAQARVPRRGSHGGGEGVAGRNADGSADAKRGRAARGKGKAAEQVQFISQEWSDSDMGCVGRQRWCPSLGSGAGQRIQSQGSTESSGSCVDTWTDLQNCGGCVLSFDDHFRSAGESTSPLYSNSTQPVAGVDCSQLTDGDVSCVEGECVIGLSTPFGFD